MMRKPKALVIYAVTSHRAVWMGCPWAALTDDADCIEVLSYHLRRNTGSVAVEGGRLCFQLACGATVIAFLWLPAVETLFAKVVEWQREARRQGHLMPPTPSSGQPFPPRRQFREETGERGGSIHGGIEAPLLATAERAERKRPGGEEEEYEGYVKVRERGQSASPATPAERLTAAFSANRELGQNVFAHYRESGAESGESLENRLEMNLMMSEPQRRATESQSLRVAHVSTGLAGLAGNHGGRQEPGGRVKSRALAQAERDAMVEREHAAAVTRGRSQSTL